MDQLLIYHNGLLLVDQAVHVMILPNREISTTMNVTEAPASTTEGPRGGEDSNPSQQSTSSKSTGFPLWAIIGAAVLGVLVVVGTAFTRRFKPAVVKTVRRFLLRTCSPATAWRSRLFESYIRRKYAQRGLLSIVDHNFLNFFRMNTIMKRSLI